MTYKICAIGNEAFLFPFLQFGFITYTPPDESKLREYLLHAIREGYGIIYIQDNYCYPVRDIIEEHRAAPVPMIVPLGESADGESYAKQAFQDMMDKAVGISLR